MSQALVVHVNRDDHHSVQPTTEHFEAPGPFVLRVLNHGAGSHLHLTFHGDLGPGRELEDDNPYLEEGHSLEVPVAVAGDHRPATGGVEVVTGYGQASTTVAVEVTGDESATARQTPDASGAPEASAQSVTAGSTAPATADAGAADVRDRRPTRDEADAGSVGPAADAVQTVTPEFTPATALLAGLALLALLAATVALRMLAGTAVTVGVLAVIATVFGAGVYLFVQ